MSPLAASSTVVNLLLATGPFSYPYGFANLGPWLAFPIMISCCGLSYITATWLVEAVSIANAVQTGHRRDSIFNEECYKTPQLRRRANDADAEMKESPFYVRQKLELGVVADRIARPWLKYTIMGVFCVYMWAAMCVKYVAGAESLYQGISFIAYGDIDRLEDKDPWIYYLSIAIFGALCLTFSFGDIENSKTLQIVSAVARIVTLLMMYGGTIYYLDVDGVSKHEPVWDWKVQKDSLATVFGNTVFVFIYHHSIPGIMYPVRPQSKLSNMFLIANIIGAIALLLEGQLAFMAFSGLPNECNDPSGTHFPCRVDKLFNENFQDIPIIGPICQFYPMLNVSAVPILTITLRNNFMQVIPVKRWIKNMGCCKILLDDHKRSVKGIWSIIFSLPVLVIVMFVKNPQVLLTYTGGICGTFILFLFPIALVHFARQSLHGKTEEYNPNASNFKHNGWLFLVGGFAVLTLGFVITGIANGTAGE